MGFEWKMTEVPQFLSLKCPSLLSPPYLQNSGYNYLEVVFDGF